MKLTNAAAVLTALFVSSISVAGTLNAGQDVEILAFDGLKMKRGTTSVPLKAGTHQAVVEVGATVEGSYFNSDQMILTFTSTDENATISAPPLNFKQDVDKFKDNQTVVIKSAAGKVIPHKQDFLKGEGFLASTRVEENLTKYNLAKKPASVEKFAHAALDVKGQMIVDTNQVSDQDLQRLFKNADKETQKRFLEWAKKNAK